jgi:hypothetical protein
MKHPKEEDLILHYYGELAEENELTAHLAACSACRQELLSLERLLQRVGARPVPERGPDYGSEVWSRLEGHLSRRRREVSTAWWLIAAALLLAATFLAGRLSSHWNDVSPMPTASLRERILLVALSDHLERSERLLIELANGGGSVGAGNERATATDLVRTTRLYRQTASQLGDGAAANTLEELERVLLDVSHGPETEEGRIRQRERIEELDVLFKLRVLQTNVRHREAELAARRF